MPRQLKQFLTPAAGAWYPGIGDPINVATLDDLSGSGNHMTLTTNGSGTINDRWVVQDGQYALRHFFGDIFADVTAPFVSAANWTIAFWFKVAASTGTNQFLFALSDATGALRVDAVVANATGQITFRVDNAAVLSHTNATNWITSGTWCHFVLTCAAGNYTLWLNGDDDSVTATAKNIGTFVRIHWGNFTATSNTFNGYLDDLMILPFVLTNTQRKLLASGRGAGYHIPATRIWARRPLLLDKPFSSQGVSVYAGNPIRYRNLRLLRSRSMLRLSTDFPAGESGINKIPRIASAAGEFQEDLEVAVDLSDYADGQVDVDVRHFKDDVESLVSAPRRFALDAGGDLADEIRGVAVLLAPEIRTGGIVRIRFRWEPAGDGIQPDQFRLTRTAGPTSPDDVTISAGSRGTYSIDTSALSDASAYTFSLIAETTDQSTQKTLLTGISVTADATGPDAPTNVITTAV